MLLMAKTYPYGSKGVLRNYHYWSDPKLSPDIVSIRIIPCISMLVQLYYIFLSIKISNNPLTSLDMV